VYIFGGNAVISLFIAVATGY